MATCYYCMYFIPEENTGVFVEKYLCTKYSRYVTANQEACPFFVENKKANSLCFLTTACVRERGLPDDCAELTTLRKFRDNYMKKTAEGEELVKEYYRIAPGIVEKIDAREDRSKIYDDIYQIILHCIDLINQNKNKEAQEAYVEMVKKYKEL